MSPLCHRRNVHEFMVVHKTDTVEIKKYCFTVKAFYFMGQKFRRLKTTDILLGT